MRSVVRNTLTVLTLIVITFLTACSSSPRKIATDFMGPETVVTKVADFSTRTQTELSRALALYGYTPVADRYSVQAGFDDAYLGTVYVQCGKLSDQLSKCAEDFWHRATNSAPGIITVGEHIKQLVGEHVSVGYNLIVEIPATFPDATKSTSVTTWQDFLILPEAQRKQLLDGSITKRASELENSYNTQQTVNLPHVGQTTLWYGDIA